MKQKNKTCVKRFGSSIVVVCVIGVVFSSIVGMAHEDEENNNNLINDRVIEFDKYPHHSVFDDGAYDLYWRIDEDRIYIAMTAETTGWIAIGFSPVSLHKASDIISGWVDANGTVNIIDCYFPDMYPPHPHDIHQNGTNDILSYTGVEEHNRTVIEFSRFLSTGDDLDNDILLNGSMEIFWSYGASDNWTEKHVNAGFAQINFSAGEHTEEGIDWLGHALVSATGLVLAILVVYNGAKLTGRIKAKKTANTFKIHRLLSILFGSITIGTFFYGLWVTSQHGAPVLLSVHGWLGIVITLFALAQLMPCVFVKKRTKIKIPHMIIGYILLILVIIQVVWGAYVAGLIF